MSIFTLSSVFSIAAHFHDICCFFMASYTYAIASFINSTILLSILMTINAIILIASRTNKVRFFSSRIFCAYQTNSTTFCINSNVLMNKLMTSNAMSFKSAQLFFSSFISQFLKIGFLPYFMARFALTISFFIYPCIRFSKFMTSNAMQFSSVKSSSTIFSRSHYFKMVRIYAVMISTSMVKMHAIRNWTFTQFKCMTMSLNKLVFIPEAAVWKSWRMSLSSQPYPARLSFINFFPEGFFASRFILREGFHGISE